MATATNVAGAAIAAPSAPPAAARAGRDVGFAVGIILILCLFFLPVPAIDDRLRPCLLDRAFRADPDGRAVDSKAARIFGVSRPSCWSRRSCGSRSTSRPRASFSPTAREGTTAGRLHHRRVRRARHGRRLRHRHHRLPHSGDDQLPRHHQGRDPHRGSRRAGSRSTPFPASRWRSTRICRRGLIDDKVAQHRRRELEEESSFFGSMDGASKFVRGDAIAGLIILAVNIFGGIVIGVTRHGLTLVERRRRLHKAVGRRRPRLANPGADHFAGRGPAGRQGRHARLGREGGARPAQPLSHRAVSGRRC